MALDYTSSGVFDLSFEQAEAHFSRKFLFRRAYQLNQ